MANFDANTLRVLEQIEDEFRNQYWIIRNSRRTYWHAVNRTRMPGILCTCLGCRNGRCRRLDIACVYVCVNVVLMTKFVVTEYVIARKEAISAHN